MLKRLARKLLPSAVVARIQHWRLARQMARFQTRQVRHRYGDTELTVFLADPLAEGWYDRDWEMLPEIALLRRHRLREGARVFDLGAHQGVVALMLARSVGPTGAVLAVEASPHNAAACERNRELNDTPWLTVLNAAVAATEGVVRINRSLNAQMAAASGYAGTVEVPAVTIDGLADRHGRPDVLFIDVEGFECQALRGAPATLATRPDSFVEVHVGAGLELLGGSVDEVLSYFPADAYDRWAHTDADPRPVALERAPPELFAHRFFLTAIARSPEP